MSSDGAPENPSEPVKVEVVRAPKGPGLVQRVVEALVLAVVISFLTTFLLALAAPKITEYVSLFHPSCADPRGLVEVPPGQIHASGPSQNAQQWPPEKVLDGRVANLWVPGLLPPDQRPAGMSTAPDFGVVDPHRSTLVLSLDHSENVQLVCVVNGLANSYTNYLNWSRVETVRAWTHSEDHGVQSTLSSMGQASFQEFQEVQVPHGDAREVMLQVLNLYEGQLVNSVDPDQCGTRDEVGPGPQNDPVGCNLDAAHQGGLAEVKVYALAGARWKALLPWH